jgi:Flp pilus assembly protein TadD
VLRSAIEASPLDAGLHHALGLALTRLKQPDQALSELRRASELEPDRARYLYVYADYVYAIALHSAGRTDDAMTILRDGLAKHPENRDILQALMSFSRDAGDMRSALDYAERLARMAPDDRDLVGLIPAGKRPSRSEVAWGDPVRCKWPPPAETR